MIVEDTLSRIACGDGAAADAREAEHREDFPSPPPSPPSGGQDSVWDEDPFLLE